jgi:lipoprotein-anchoring transpeptidase ErfK/SrfK
MNLTRRAFAIGAPLTLAGCISEPPLVVRAPGGFPGVATGPYIDASFREIYGPVTDGRFLVPAVDLTKISSPEVLRREVDYDTRERPGTVVVDPGARFAYYVMPGGRAIRYGVGVGKVDAFNFVGAATIGRKATWPGWTPTAAMIRRDPERYRKWAGGMEGGPWNPLGARALYLYRGGRDTYYRLHGTNEPSTIGTRVSSGCVRFFNQDIIHLHSLVPAGAKVVVLPTRRSAGA